MPQQYRRRILRPELIQLQYPNRLPGPNPLPISSAGGVVSPIRHRIQINHTNPRSRVVSMRRLVVFALALCAGLPAHARLIINLMYDSSVNSYVHKAAMQSAFAYAVQEYGNLFVDPVTVNIRVIVDSDPNDFGSSLTQYTSSFTYAQIRNAMIAHAATAADAAAIASLAVTDPTRGGPYFLTRAQAKALGFLAANDPGLDGTIYFGSPVAWTFDPDRRMVSGTTD